jgi:[ribosomal protein S5]-alanine N-acetyltransferase
MINLDKFVGREEKMNLNNIQTNRLILVPVSIKLVKDLIKESTKEIENLGIKTNGRWPRQDTKDILPFVDKDFEKNKIETGFEFWMIVIKENMTVIGDIGFRGIPDDKGEVEIGFGLIEEEQGKGYGQEALKAMINWAFSDEKVKVINADCLIDNIPSIRILEKSGFKESMREKGMVWLKIFNDLIKN